MLFTSESSILKNLNYKLFKNSSCKSNPKIYKNLIFLIIKKFSTK